MTKLRKRKRKESPTTFFGNGCPLHPSLIRNLSESQTVASIPLKGTTAPVPKESSSLKNFDYQAYTNDHWGSSNFLKSLVLYDQENPSLALVSFHSKAAVTLSGHLCVTLCYGSVKLNGFLLNLGQKLEVISPHWCVSVPVEIETSSKPKTVEALVQSVFNRLKTQLPSYSQQISKEAINILIQDSACLLLIESQSLDNHNREWLLKSEDYSKYSIINKIQINTITTSNMISFESLFIGDKHHAQTIGIESMQLPQNWIDCSQTLLDNHSNQKSSVLLCGAKGVGKSTYLRYLINRYLSEFGMVAVIDCDLGQPEFTPPGLVSIHLLENPILKPAHLNICEPDLAYFIGDVISKHDPVVYVECIKRLYEHYHKILKIKYESIMMKKRKVIKTTNSFSVLDEENEQKIPDLPLLINTDGYIKYLGEEILRSVLDVITPAHVIHICNDKNRDVAAISNYLTGHPDATVMEVPPGRSSPGRIPASDLRALRLASYFLRGNRTLNSMAAIIITPETSTTATATASTSTTQNMTKGIEAHPHADFSLPEGCSSYLDDSSQKEAPTVATNPATVGREEVPVTAVDGIIDTSEGGAMAAIEKYSLPVTIRSGKLIDPTNLMARSLLTSPTLMVPLYPSVTNLYTIGSSSSVSPRLILAAMNAMIVGIVADSLPTVGVPQPTYKLRVGMDGPYSSESGEDLDEYEGNKNQDDLIRLSYQTMTTTNLSPCIGLGIVKFIDVGKKELCIITPLDIQKLNSLEHVGLVRGNLQLPSLFSYVPGLFTYPYLSGEVMGEGSNTMRTRTNVKRRSQRP